MTATHVDIAALLSPSDDASHRVLWSATGQLQTNLVSLSAGARVEQHVEGDLDVLLVVVQGGGVLTTAPDTGVAPVELAVTAPAAIVLPAGTARSIAAGPAGLAYVTAHRRRPGLLPAMPRNAPPG